MKVGDHMADYVYTDDGIYSVDELKHYGVLGMKWGVRRYQNPDGTLTPAGRKRQAKQYEKELNRLDKEGVKAVSDYRVSDTRLRSFASKTLKRVNGNIDAIRDIDTQKAIRLKAQNDLNLDRYKRIESATWKIIAKVHDAGYTLEQAKRMKYVMRGSDYVTAALAGPVAGSLITSIIDQKKYGGKYGVAGETARIIEGNKWKVRANG